MAGSAVAAHVAVREAVANGHLTLADVARAAAVSRAWRDAARDAWTEAKYVRLGTCVRENGGHALGRMLAKHPRAGVEHLDLSFAGLGDLGVELATAGLDVRGACPRLHTLDLAANALGPLATGKLAKALESGACASLRTIRLNFNNLGAAGASTLFASVRSGAFACLVRLHLDHNLVGDRGAFSFASALGYGMGALREASLQVNGLTRLGVRRLAVAAVTRTERLVALHLAGNIAWRAAEYEDELNKLLLSERPDLPRRLLRLVAER